MIKDYGREHRYAVPQDLAEEFQSDPFKRDEHHEHIYPQNKLLDISTELDVMIRQQEDQGFFTPEEVDLLKRAAAKLNEIWYHANKRITGE